MDDTFRIKLSLISVFGFGFGLGMMEFKFQLLRGFDVYYDFVSSKYFKENPCSRILW